ncbi:uncharacterized protein LOC131646996 [Vicia villosa]|uniref:uncharacterized protein LOC131646996 n=1 Tax=Vicia villosa TaxID=3911 RepID=UPI00273CB5E9|nr:uncharacterized protein LOC131646996 [Vicia villosa]
MASLLLLLLLLLILCGSLHACTPRPLTKNDTTKHHFDKDLDSVKTLKMLTTLSVKEHNKVEENTTQQQKIVNNDINIGVGCSSASTLKKVIVEPSCQTGSPSLLVAKDERGHARSMLGPGRHHVEETMVTNTNENAEDIVEMDYAQPHRKPPIHNENP